MALRARLTLMSAVIVGVILVLASLVAYAAVREQQRGQVDDALRGNAAFYQRLAARAGGGPPPGQPGRAHAAAQPRRPRRLRPARAAQRQRDPARPGRRARPCPVTGETAGDGQRPTPAAASPIARSTACTCAC